MKKNVFNVCRRGFAKKNATAQVPDGYLICLTNREMEMIEGGNDVETKHVLINGVYVRVHVPKKLT